MASTPLTHRTAPPPFLAPYEQPTIEEQFRAASAERRRRSATVFGTAFSPAGSSGGCGGAGGGSETSGGRYLLGCSSFGTVCVWDAGRASSAEGAESRSGRDPLISFDVTKGSGPLYDISFIHSNSEPYVVASGRGGAYLYQWSDIQSEIERIAESSSPNTPNKSTNVTIEPRTIFKVHPSPYGTGSISRTSFDPTRNTLYGAADDGFGTYVWDVDRRTLLGTLGAGGPAVHAVRSIGGQDGPSGSTVLTGGEGGTLDVWDGKEMKLVQSIDCKSALVAGAGGGGGGGSSSSSSSLVSSDCCGGGPWSATNAAGMGLWVSSIAVRGGGQSWAAVGGGVEPLSGGAAASASSSSPGKSPRKGGASSSSSSSSTIGGFVSLWHLPTRSLSSAYVTRESIQDLTYHRPAEKLVSVANEGVVSTWNTSDVARGRAGRAWTTSPSGYSVAVNGRNGLMAVGGVGCTVDCFADLGNRSFGFHFR